MKATILFVCVVGLTMVAASEALPRDWSDISISDDNNRNVIDVPVVCKPNEAPDANGRCRPIYREAVVQQESNNNSGSRIKSQQLLACLRERIFDSTIDCSNNIQTVSVIEVPITCPQGYRPDANGRCRPIFRSVE